MNRRLTLIVLAHAAVAGLPFLDWLTPLGYGEWILYLVPVLIISLTRERFFIIESAALCSALLLAGVYISPLGISRPVALINRLGTIAVIWLFVSVALRQFRMAHVLLREQQSRLKSEARFRSTFDNAAVGMAHLSPAGEWQMVNDRLCAIMGYSRDQLIGRSYEEFSHPDEIEQDRMLSHKLNNGELPFFRLEKRYVRPDGFPVWIQITKSVQRDARGAPEYHIGVIEDITQRKNAENSLLESESRYRQLADSMPQLVWTARPDGTIDYYNSHYLDFEGILPGRDGSWTWSLVLHKEDEQATMEAWRHSVQTGDAYQIEHRVRHADRTFHWYLSRAIPARSEQGKIIRWYGTATNIDSIKQSQAALEESRKKLKTLNENLENVVVERTEQVRALSRALALAEQRERKQFSQVLHENLQQILFAAKMHIDQHVIDHERRGSLMKDDEIEGSAALLTKAIEVTRAMALELNPPILRRQGLSDALEWLAKHMYQAYGLSTSLDIDPETASVRGERQLMLVQMTRELLNNVLRHAGVKEAALQATCQNGRIQISVRDSGVGFDPAEAPETIDPEERFGLFSIEEKLRLFGGKLTIESAPGKGTKATMEAPCE